MVQIIHFVFVCLPECVCSCAQLVPAIMISVRTLIIANLRWLGWGWAAAHSFYELCFVSLLWCYAMCICVCVVCEQNENAIHCLRSVFGIFRSAHQMSIQLRSDWSRNWSICVHKVSIFSVLVGGRKEGAVDEKRQFNLFGICPHYPDRITLETRSVHVS